MPFDARPTVAHRVVLGRHADALAPLLRPDMGQLDAPDLSRTWQARADAHESLPTALPSWSWGGLLVLALLGGLIWALAIWLGLEAVQAIRDGMERAAAEAYAMRAM